MKHNKLSLPIVLVLMVSFLFTACFVAVSPAPSPAPTQLTVENDTAIDLELIYWIADSGKKFYFTKDQVYDSVLGYYVGGLKSGSLQTLGVTPGSSYIYFFYTDSGTQKRTIAVLTVNSGESWVFKFTDSTVVSTASVQRNRAKAAKEALPVQ